MEFTTAEEECRLARSRAKGDGPSEFRGVTLVVGDGSMSFFTVDIASQRLSFRITTEFTLSQP